MHGEWKNKIRFSFCSLKFVNNAVIHWRDLIFFLISPLSIFTIFFFFFWEPWERLWQLILFHNRESKSAMILLPRSFHNFDSYGHEQKRLDIPKINLNSRRQYTHFTYKPHIIKAILLTTKDTKEENVTEN